MLICHCTAANDESIRLHIADTNDTVEDISTRCGAGGQCGGCHEAINAVIRQHRERD